MATLRVGTLTPTALRMGTVTVTAAYMGTVAVWPLVAPGAIAGAISASSNRATAVINGTYTVSSNFIGTIAGSSNRATAAINVTFTPTSQIFYRTFNGTTDAFAANIGNLASANSVPETWVVACRITVPVAADGEIIHGVSTAAGAATPGFDPLDLYLTTSGVGKWHFFSGITDFPNGPDATALDTIVVLRRGAGTNVRWSVSSHNGTTWSSFTHGDEAAPSTNRPYAATGVLEFCSNPGVASRMAAVARYNTALTDAQINTQFTGDLATWAAVPSITNLWRFDQTPIIDSVGTATQNTLTGTTTPGFFPLNAVPIGTPPAVTAVLTATSNRQTAVISSTFAGGPVTMVLTGTANRQTAVINAVLAGVISGPITASSNRATAVVNATFTAPAAVTGTVTATANRQTAVVNATVATGGSGFAKYRTFNGSSNIRFTLGNLSGVSSNPRTIVAVARLLTGGGDKEIICAPGFDPLDLFWNGSPIPKEIQNYDGASTITGQAWDTFDGWSLIAFRSLVGAAAKTSKSVYTTSWATPTHTTQSTTMGVRTWPTSGLITIGDGTTNGDGPLYGDVVCIAHFNVALSDAQINAMTAGVSAIQATSGITNLWMVGQTTPADLVGTSTLSAVTGATLSTGDSPFPT